jgi:small basic protein (TIGR04137 family)
MDREILTMSIHSSLSKKGFGQAHRNVLKRFERIKTLNEQERWLENASVLGLPKVKSIKLKKK